MIRHSARWIHVEVVDVEVRERDDEVERTRASMYTAKITTKTTSKNQSAHKYVHNHAIQIFILSNIFFKKSAIVVVFTLR